MRKHMVAAVLMSGAVLSTACSSVATSNPQSFRAAARTTTQRPSVTVPPTIADHLTAYGASAASWKASHQRDADYMGLPAYGPTISTPEGPTPQYVVSCCIEQDREAGNVTQYYEMLPNGTSLDAARAAALRELPSDAQAVSFVTSDPAYQRSGQSCAFWNLSSSTLAQVGLNQAVYVEMAYDDSSGAPTFQPNDVNTLTFIAGSSGTGSDQSAC
jgi:hypothetical protein